MADILEDKVGLLYDMVSDCDLEVKVAHPFKVKAIAEVKIKTERSKVTFSKT